MNQFYIFRKSKIRLTLNESQKLDVFFEEVKSSKVKETAFVLAKLFLENAFVPCYTQKEVKIYSFIYGLIVFQVNFFI